MLIAIDRQYPGDEDKQRLARQILARVLKLADEAAEIAGELEAQARAAGLRENLVSMIQRVTLRVRLAHEDAQRRSWDDMNRRLNTIMADATHGIRDSSASDLEACERYLDKLSELSSAQSRLNQDIATPDFKNLQEYLRADLDELKRAEREAGGYPSGRRLIEWA